MGSILTNTGAMVALQTLKSVNMNMETVQSQISTGKDVATAKDDAAVWAISKVMESDVKGFDSISATLGLGESTVAVASSAAETVTELLVEMKAKIVYGQEENVDRAKIQKDIDELANQIEAVVGAAQFNGLNLLTNKELESDSNEVDVLASLDRSGGGVAASDITVNKQDLGLEAAEVGAMSLSLTGATTTLVAGGAAATFITFSELTDVSTSTAYDEIGVDAGMSFSVIAIEDANADLTFSDTVDYVAREGDTMSDVVSEMVNRLNYQAALDGFDVTFTAGDNVGEVMIANTGDLDITIEGTATQTEVDGSDAAGTIGGGLELVGKIDVTAENGEAAALASLENLIQTSIDAAAAFGSSAGRIETQMNFVSSLTDALEAGIGTLVDADMEEASARLQALQVQQQLAVQALSIANQQPQTLLSLFR